jgi:hypothetical protein
MLLVLNNTHYSTKHHSNPTLKRLPTLFLQRNIAAAFGNEIFAICESHQVAKYSNVEVASKLHRICFIDG